MQAGGGIRENIGKGDKKSDCASDESITGVRECRVIIIRVCFKCSRIRCN